MSAAPPGLRPPGARSVKGRLDALRTEFADLAWALEGKGRRDAADVVMLIDQRVREIADEIAAGETAAAPGFRDQGVGVGFQTDACGSGLARDGRDQRRSHRGEST